MRCEWDASPGYDPYNKHVFKGRNFRYLLLDDGSLWDTKWDRPVEEEGYPTNWVRWESAASL